MATVQTVPTLIGQVGFNPQGEYQSNKQYVRLDVVTKDGSSYACKKDCQNIDVTNTEYWQLIASKGDSYVVTQEDLQEIAREIEEDASSSFNQNVEAKTTQFNQNARNKTTDFNNNATTETENFDSHVATKIEEFNTNSTSKTNAFNSNATTKTSTFNTNATNKTTDFDNNATSKTSTFNENTVQKTIDFNNNAEDKTEDYNDNATSKTAEFNANFEDKNTMLEKNFSSSTAVIEGSGQISNALYWDAKRVNKIGGVQLEQDTTSIAQGDEYDSPTPEHEQPIKMLSGDVVIEPSNKNFFTPVLSGGCHTATGTYFSDSSKGTASKNNGVMLPPGTYTCSFYSSVSSFYPSYIYLVLWADSSKQTFKDRYTFNAGPSSTGIFDGDQYNVTSVGNGLYRYTKVFTLGSPAYIEFSIYSSDAYGHVYDFQIEINSTATYFIEHEGQTFPLTLPEGMYLGDLGTASNFIFKNEKNSPYYNSSLTENANYWHKGWNKRIFDGTENWYFTNTQPDDTNLKCCAVSMADRKGNVFNQLSNLFRYIANSASTITNATEEGLFISGSTAQIGFITKHQTPELLKSWLAEKYQAGTPVYLCYELVNEEDVLITDTTLNAQLNAMWEQMQTYGITNFTITGGDINGKLDLDYYVDDRIDENGVSVLDKLATLEARVELLEQ